MPEEENKIVTLEMPYNKFHSIKKKLETIENDFSKLRIHEGFKDAMVNDIKAISAMLTTSKRG